MTSFGYPKGSRLLKRRQFQSLNHNSEQFYGKVLHISWRRTSLGFCRLGITVSAKAAPSVVRNRFKRLVREAFRILFAKQRPISFDLNVKPKGKMAHAPSFQAIVNDFTCFLENCSRE